MKKTYVTKMPNHIGAFLKASKCFSRLGINITRVSYNKAVDSHTLFIEVCGDAEKLEKANEMLTEIGYLPNGEEMSKIVLLEFLLRDEPGSVTSVLELISNFNLNISYISSQENGSGYQQFKMGLHVSDPAGLDEFLTRAREICDVRIIDYNNTEKVYDNSIFYDSYVSGLVKTMALSKERREELLVYVNLAMQTLDERGLSPYKTFDSISRFAELLAECKGEHFNPRITEHRITEKTRIILIEPDCGSNTAIIESDGERLFVDSGYACYRAEMMDIIRSLIPDFGDRQERLLITHADVDHCGLMNAFDEVIVSQRSAESLSAEAESSSGFREQNRLHLPYVNICKILTEYEPVDKNKLRPMWNRSSLTAPIEQIGFYKVGELEFEVYEGRGGHLSGEILLVDFEHRIAFSGDVFINLSDLTKKQAEYNKYAPILMTSVDTDQELCARERSALLRRLGAGEWSIFGGHGQRKSYSPEGARKI